MVKTVGDAVIVAGPLFSGATKADCMNYGKRIAEFALEISTNIETPMHIGINTGPVVAGVIGRKRFAYDIYGKSMDLASELGSVGAPGKLSILKVLILSGSVFVSESFMNMLPNEFIYMLVKESTLEKLKEGDAMP